MKKDELNSIVSNLFKNKTIEQIKDIKPSYWVVDEWEENGQFFESYNFYVDNKLKLTTSKNGFKNLYKTIIKK